MSNYTKQKFRLETVWTVGADWGATPGPPLELPLVGEIALIYSLFRKYAANTDGRDLKNKNKLVGQSSPYCEGMWGRYCCLTCFSDCRYVP